MGDPELSRSKLDDAWRDTERVRAKLVNLFEELIVHPGFGEMHVSVKILKQGKKEVILSCGREYRSVLQPVPPPKATEKGGAPPE